MQGLSPVADKLAGSRVFFDIKIGDGEPNRVAFELVSYPHHLHAESGLHLTSGRHTVQRWYDMIFPLDNLHMVNNSNSCPQNCGQFPSLVYRREGHWHPGQGIDLQRHVCNTPLPWR